jgi:hypothetical protein
MRSNVAIMEETWKRNYSIFPRTYLYSSSRFTFGGESLWQLWVITAVENVLLINRGNNCIGSNNFGQKLCLVISPAHVHTVSGDNAIIVVLFALAGHVTIG